MVTKIKYWEYISKRNDWIKRIKINYYEAQGIETAYKSRCLMSSTTDQPGNQYLPRYLNPTVNDHMNWCHISVWQLLNIFQYISTQTIIAPCGRRFLDLLSTCLQHLSRWRFPVASTDLSLSHNFSNLMLSGPNIREEWFDGVYGRIPVTYVSKIWGRKERVSEKYTRPLVGARMHRQRHKYSRFVGTNRVSWFHAEVSSANNPSRVMRFPMQVINALRYFPSYHQSRE